MFFGLRLTFHDVFFPQARNAAPAFTVQSRSYAEAKASPTEVSSILEQRIRGVSEESNLAETGRVLSVGYVQKRNAIHCIGGARPRDFSWVAGSDNKLLNHRVSCPPSTIPFLPNTVTSSTGPIGHN